MWKNLEFHLILQVYNVFYSILRAPPYNEELVTWALENGTVLNLDTNNHTKFDMLHLLGIQKAMERGFTEAIKPSQNGKIRH